jgi:hypothetical protein
VFEQRQTIGTPWKQQLKMQEQDIGVSPIKGYVPHPHILSFLPRPLSVLFFLSFLKKLYHRFMHNKDYFGPVAAAHEEDEEEMLPNILDESGNETTIMYLLPFLFSSFFPPL